jgi:hypothetical protein
MCAMQSDIYYVWCILELLRLRLFWFMISSVDYEFTCILVLFEYVLEISQAWRIQQFVFF